MRVSNYVFVLLLGFALIGCQMVSSDDLTQALQSGTEVPAPPELQARPENPVIAVTPSPTPTLTQVPSTPTMPQPGQIEPSQDAAVRTETPETEPPCSPLADISLLDLPEILSNPYDPTITGRDGIHPGVDLAFFRWRGYESINGHEVQAVWSGRVAGIGTRRLPYGNYVVVETPYKVVPAGWRASAGLQPGQAIYHLYAHLQEPPDLAVHDQVACGQPLGKVGTTGASVVPHLHLEVRIGPDAVDFGQMAYYDTRANKAEMSEYETWRIQGPFRPIDPAALLFGG